MLVKIQANGQKGSFHMSVYCASVHVKIWGSIRLFLIMSSNHVLYCHKQHSYLISSLPLQEKYSDTFVTPQLLRTQLHGNPWSILPLKFPNTTYLMLALSLLMILHHLSCHLWILLASSYSLKSCHYCFHDDGHDDDHKCNPYAGKCERERNATYGTISTLGQNNISTPCLLLNSWGHNQQHSQNVIFLCGSVSHTRPQTGNVGGCVRQGKK